MPKTLEEYQKENIELQEKIKSFEVLEIDYKKTIEEKDSLIEKNNLDIEKLREHNNYLFTRVQQPPMEDPQQQQQVETALSTADLVSKLIGGK